MKNPPIGGNNIAPTISLKKAIIAVNQGPNMSPENVYTTKDKLILVILVGINPTTLVNIISKLINKPINTNFLVLFIINSSFLIPSTIRKRRTVHRDKIFV